MIAALKAEVRKLLTVRSTYGILAILVVIADLLIGLWVSGYRDAFGATADPTALMTSLTGAVSFGNTLMAVVAIILVGNEYRHNTILYSLTNTAKRGRVFASKWLVMIVFALLAVALAVALNAPLFYLGHHLSHHALVAQHAITWPVVGYWAASTVGMIAYALTIIFLTRNQILSLVGVLVLPGVIEGLLGLLLKTNSKFLPFTALGDLQGATGSKAVVFSLLVVAAYSVVGLIASYVLFKRRDAN